MPGPPRRGQRRPEGENPRVSEGDNDANDTEPSAPSHRTDFRPPRSRTPTSSRQGGAPSRHISQEAPLSARGTTVRWSEKLQHPMEGGGAEMPGIFSPSRSSPQVCQICPKFNPSRIFCRYISIRYYLYLLLMVHCFNKHFLTKPFLSFSSPFAPHSSFDLLPKMSTSSLFRAPRHPTNSLSNRFL